VIYSGESECNQCAEREYCEIEDGHLSLFLEVQKLLRRTPERSTYRECLRDEGRSRLPGRKDPVPTLRRSVLVIGRARTHFLYPWRLGRLVAVSDCSATRMGVSKLTLATIDQRSVASDQWMHVQMQMQMDCADGGPDGRPVDQWAPD
jgi:hypothetical protein